MLRVLGSKRQLCDGLSRRDLLHAGGAGLLGLGLGDLWRLRAAAAAQPQGGSLGRAKACIILYLYGAPSQLELFDPKPDAPAEIRGELGTIDTAVPGLRICEHLPHLARVLDRATVVRSMTHPFNIHSAAYTLTGVPQVDVPMELNPADRRHWPYIGSVLDFLAEGRHAPQPPVPRSIGMPFQFSSRAKEFARGGPYGGFLGSKYDPVWTEFEGQATRSVARWRGNVDNDVADPYLGISADSRFVLSPAAQLPPEITLDRLNQRRSLLAQFDDQRRDLSRTPGVETHTRFQQMAFSLMASPDMRSALDLRREDQALRERYGMTLFGQATLAARRLVEAGSQLVTVFWDEYGTANSAWDTHFDHYPRLKDELLPGLDRALSTLILDLEARGLLDSTLVACISEHGRTPLLQNVRGGGRGHWSRAYCGMFAGGGVHAGQVIGRSDRHAADVVDRPVSPKDILSTAYHLLGVPPDTMLHDRLGRPLPLVADGKLVSEMIG
ncbi:MAG TPA: DUF1501 domain-containing protein [Pirellulales bacterium]|jgi:uncharacterized protein (DUF1501 family)|nr:DUF1501 domain-containing protein [Pirellulales bacterium]